MKWVALAIYVVLVAMGALAIVLRSHRNFEFTASRNLPFNHRVLDSDLHRPDPVWALAPPLPESSRYTGRYLNRKVCTGEALKLEYLKMRPAIEPALNTEPVPWFLHDGDRKWLEVLDVGWRVDLCSESCPVMDAQVLALDCDSPTANTCAAVLQLTAAQRDALMTYPNKNKLTLAVSKPELGGGK